MNTQTVTLQVEPSTATLLQVLREKAAAQGVSLDALLKPLAEEVAAPTHSSFEQIEGLLGVFDSREPFERPVREHDAFGRGVIAKLEKQGLKLP